MLQEIDKLPHKHFGLSYVKTLSGYSCEFFSIGLKKEEDPRKYFWDNTYRDSLCVFQYTIEGKGLFKDKQTGNIYEVSPGKGFLVVLPSPTQYWLPQGEYWRFIYLTMSGDIVFYHCKELIKRYGFIFDLPFNSKGVDILFKIYFSFLNNNIMNELDLSSLLYSFLMELYKSKKFPVKTLPEEIERVVKYIEQKYSDPFLSVEDMAKICGYSRYHFSRIFKKYMGITPYNCLINIRLKKALKLLTHTNLPIKKISQMVGFNDYSYFCNTFKKYIHLSPAQLREQHKCFKVSEVYTIG